ncbi:MAG: Hsp33 family molecular chaperone [Alphaproteobacteria bacterium]
MSPAPHPPSDDLVAPFQIESEPVRGRVVRLGPAIDDILSRHNYPDAVANLVGEACALAALVGASLKFDGRLILQAQGDGPVSFVVADYDTAGDLRAYCRYNEDRVAEACEGFARPGAKTLLGDGVFIMTLDQGPDMERYQGVTPIEGETLALCAERYFAQSEQTPTRVLLATAQVRDSGPDRWRAGGLILQNIAGDAARGSTDEAWNTVQAHFGTLGEDELVDPTISPATLLFRLFHEEGVRLFDTTAVRSHCRCSREKILSVLGSFPSAERGDMVDVEGRIEVTCEYCSRVYQIEPEALEGEQK